VEADRARGRDNIGQVHTFFSFHFVSFSLYCWKKRPVNPRKFCGKLRIPGELIKANLHQIEAGATRVRVQNFYDVNLADIEISLDPALSPQANAAKYFKDYKKAHTAEQTLSSLIENDEKELAYLETVSFNLSRAEAVSDIAEIREELAAAGYIRAQREAKAKKPAPKFTEFTSPSGYRVLVGKNNLQNDLLTTKIAEKNDMWFHTKNIAGSHVIVACGSAELTREDILFAATLAAKNSRAGASSQVPVDYTRIKNVKKPAGAKAGMVIYLTNSTVYVTPSEVNND
jgi:predicted ribosome quality control (RQC) complex YloA/Tae2 family protein